MSAVIEKSSRFLPTTRTAIRVAISSMLALTISWMASERYPFLVVLVAALVAAASIGSSIQMSIQRLLMTLVGCLAGAGVYLITPDILLLQQFVLLCSIFFVVYFMGISYPWMMFAVTVMYVFLMGLSGLLTFYTLELRVLDTLVGGACAVIVAYLIFPERSETSLLQHIQKSLINCKELFTFIKLTYLSRQFSIDEVKLQKIINELNTSVMNALTTLQSSRYEQFSSELSFEYADLFVLEMERMAAFLQALPTFFIAPIDPILFQATLPKVERVFNEIDEMYHILLSNLFDKKDIPFNDSPLQTFQIIEQIKNLPEFSHEIANKQMHFYTLFYYCLRVKRILGELILLSQSFKPKS